ncbi:MAG: thermopsin family protease, partial [Thermoproteus sp.]|nr:thermopsin family protease [Thermoproteus sp.]
SLLPSGLYADAEFVTGGPGGGSSAAPLAYNATYQLFYLSAGKLTPVPHAYNYGADTAEAVYNTADAGYTSPTPHAVLTVGNEYFHDLW